MLVASMLGTLPAGPAAAAGTVFDPLPNATTVNGGVYTSVVADGAGTFHAVMREDAPGGLGQWIAYRTSTDGGRSWTERGHWAGEAGGGTRPVLAVDGNTVAVAFIGGYREPGAGSALGEAPYLVMSRDAGQTFGAPLRLYNNAFTVSVGVDGSRVWVAWHGRDLGNNDVVVMRGYRAGGAMLAERSLPGTGTPRVAAGGGGGVISYLRQGVGDGEEGRLFGRAQLLDATGFAAVPEWPLDGASGNSVPVDSASAGGRVHLLFREGGTAAISRFVVRSAKVGDAALGAPVSAISGSGASIAAREGLVAVSAVDPTTGVTSVVRSKDGAAFSAPVVVARTSGGAYSTDLAVAVRPAWRPTAVFDWKVEPRYTDRDGDGYPDPANSGRAPALDVALPADEVEVHLDGCASVGSAGNAITKYVWTVAGNDLTATTCRATAKVANGQAVGVRLQVTTSAGDTDARTVQVTPKDHLVVSLGDSVASGEGNPHVPASLSDLGSEVWEDGPCHRSHFSGPAVAARQLEESDPHSSVTFVQLSCSGAAMMDVPKVPGDPVDGTDAKTGGVLDGYHGVEPDGSGARPSQLEQMTALIGARVPDSVMISIGANDVVFSDVLLGCLIGECLTDGTKQVLDQRLGDLPRRYAALGKALADLKVPDAAVVLSEYYDVASNSLGLSDLKCVANADNTRDLRTLLGGLTGLGLVLGPIGEVVLGDGLVTDDEAIWSREYLGARINEEVRAGAQAQGWRVVGGFDAGFARHGYCADQSWIVRVPGSVLTQHDEKGAFHPNKLGHEEYGRKLGTALVKALVEPSPLDPAAPPTAAIAGDLYVTTGGDGDLTVAGVLDEGSRVVPLGQRRLDRVISGSGYVTGGGAPAADTVSAVATWTQLSQGSTLSWRAALAQVSVVENARVDSVSFTQGPELSKSLVAGRDTVVLPRITLAAAGSKLLDVTTVVTDDQGAVVLDATDQVTFTPGNSIAGLPTGQKFKPEMGKKYTAQVTVSDPISAGPGADADNSIQTATGDFPELKESRELRMIELPLKPEGEKSPECASLYSHEYGGQHAAGMMPAAKVTGQRACAQVGPFPTDDRGVSLALSELDYLARLTAQDSMVATAPSRWLMRAFPDEGVLGIANSPGRGIVVNQDAPFRVLAHEMTHNLGYDHYANSAIGWWVARGHAMFGRDYMAQFDSENWVSAPMWDKVITTIGGPENAPKLPDPAAPGVWVRGDVVRNDKGEWVPLEARWVPAGTGETTDPRLTDPELMDTLELERVVARQVDAAGNEVASQKVPLGEVGAIYAPGATPTTEPLGYTWAGLVNPVNGAARIEVTLDGAVVDSRPLNQRPTVTLDAPAPGAAVGRGPGLEVAWTASDPDGDALTTDLLVSADGGTTWQPLATDVGDSPATVTVPAHLDGATRIRVVVSDGVRMAMADSAEFTVGSSAGEINDRVAFTRGGHTVYDAPRLHLMDPDGAQLEALPLPATQDWSGTPYRVPASGEPIGYQCQYTNGGPSGSCAPQYLDSAWSPDGKRLYFTSDLIADGFGGAEAPGLLFDRIDTHLWSVAADGTDLRRVTAPQTSPQTTVPAPYSVTNRCVDVGADRIVWFGKGMVYDGGLKDPEFVREAIWTAKPDGTEQRRLFAWKSSSKKDPTAWPAFDGSGWDQADPAIVGIALIGPEGSPYVLEQGCPELSPDGTRLAFTALVSRVDTSGSERTEVSAKAVLVVGTDGSGLRVVTNRDPISPEPLNDAYSVDWSSSSTLLVTRQACDGNLVCTYASTAVDIDTSPPTQTVITGPLVRDKAPRFRQVNPDGLLYGFVGANYSDTDLGVLDPATGVSTRVVSGTPTGETQFAWGRLAGGGPDVPVVVPEVPVVPVVDAGGPYSATAGVPVVLSAGGSLLAGDGAATVDWDLDGDGAFDDASGRNPEVVFSKPGTLEVRVRVTSGSGSARASEPVEVVVLAAPPPVFEADPNAVGPVVGAPGPVDLAVSIPAGETRAVRLGAADGPVLPWVVVGFDPQVLSVVSGDGAVAGSGLPTVGALGEVRVTPAVGFRGKASITYASPDDPSVTATVAVTVTGNAAPVAVDDALAVDVGVQASFPVSALLANDTDPDGGLPLRVVQVTGMTAGEAWLTADADQVVVRADRAGTAEFGYVVADRAGGIGQGRVVVTVRGGATPPPVTPPPTVTGPPAPDPAPVVTSSATGKVYFAYKSTDLSKAEKRKLRRMVARIPEGATVVLARSVGVVRAKGDTRADQRRALKRAAVVRDYLVSQGLTGPISISNSGRTSAKSPAARRVNVTIIYSVP